MFAVDPEGTQQMFESMPVEPERREYTNSDGEVIVYYMYDF